MKGHTNLSSLIPTFGKYSFCQHAEMNQKLGKIS